MSKYIYYYSEKVKVKTTNGFKEKFFKVFRVCENTNKDTNLMARKFARIKKQTLAGGLFHNNCKPYNFKTHYKVYVVPKSYKEDNLNKHDLFIANLISYEQGDLNQSETKKFFKENKDTLKHLQGHYSSKY